MPVVEIECQVPATQGKGKGKKGTQTGQTMMGVYFVCDECRMFSKYIYLDWETGERDTGFYWAKSSKKLSCPMCCVR